MWLTLVLGGHLSNACAFVIDKILLSKTLKRPTVYVFFIGVLGIFVFVLLPFGHVQWLSSMVTIEAAISGIAFTAALLAFFSALQRGEATRVIPFFGALIPLWTIAFAWVFVGERLTGIVWWGIALLVIGAFLITYEPTSNNSLSRTALGLAVLGAALFAISSTMLKAVFNATEFINGFLWTRTFATLSALALLLLPATRRAVWSEFVRGGQRPPALLIVGQALGAIGFVLLALGTKFAPTVTVVNALQGVQYGFLFLFVLVMGSLAPKLIPEKMSRAIVIQKIIALVALALGLALAVS